MGRKRKKRVTAEELQEVVLPNDRPGRSIVTPEDDPRKQRDAAPIVALLKIRDEWDGAAGPQPGEDKEG